MRKIISIWWGTCSLIIGIVYYTAQENLTKIITGTITVIATLIFIYSLVVASKKKDDRLSKPNQREISTEKETHSYPKPRKRNTDTA